MSIEKKNRLYIKQTYDILYRRLTNKIMRNTRVLTTQNEKDIIRELKRYNYTKMTTGQLTAIMNSFETLFNRSTEENNTKIENMSFNIIHSFSQALFKRNKTITAKLLNTKTSWDQKDQNVVKHISSTSSFFIKDNMGTINKSMSSKAQKIIQKGLDKGLGINTIRRALEKEITGSYSKNQKKYFEVVASNAVAKSQNYSEIMTYGQAGVEFYEYTSVLDEATTNYCQFMNGRRFSVAAGVNRIDEEMGMTGEELLEKSPFVRQTAARDKSINFKVKVNNNTINIGNSKTGVNMSMIESYGLNLPPAHHRCRSTLLPVL